jgi:peptide deformylase
MVMPIVQVGDPVLRRQTDLVNPRDLAALSALIQDMRETMHQAPGVGLAAPQIGRSLRMAVIEDGEQTQSHLAESDRAERQRDIVPFEVIVNPRLTVTDPTPLTFFEGCLSVRGYVALVARAQAVRVDGLDAQGRPIVIEASGWHARILQHEIDHLDGVLYVDRMISRSFSTSENHQKHIGGLSMVDVRKQFGLP